MLSKRKAITVFCYLAMIDGEFSEDEHIKIDEIGETLDNESYAGYKDEIIEQCAKQLERIIDEEDYYDVIAEGVDSLIFDNNEEERSVGIRLLLWDLLVIAHSDGEYSPPERRLIKHIVRVTDTDKSIFLEMEQLIKTFQILEKEKNDLADSNKPYSEVAPLMTEIDSRMKAIKESSLNLIADEELMRSIEKIEVKQDIVDNAINEIKETATEATTIVKDKVTPAATVVKDKASPVISQAGDKLNSFVSGAVSKFSRKGKK